MDRAGVAALSEKARLLLELSREISSSLDLQEVLDKSLFALRKLVDFDGGSIQLVEEGSLRLVAAEPPAPPEVYRFRLPIGEGFGGRVATTGEPIYSPDATIDERAHPEGRAKASTAGVRSYFAAPLIESGHAMGVVQLDSRTVDAFSIQSQELVLSFVPTIAAAVQNARLFAREIDAINQQLESERLKTDFLAVVSHELRTPLTSVIGLADTLEGHAGDFDAEMIHDCARRISLAGRTLERLIEDLLRLSRAEGGRLRFSPAATGLTAVLRAWAETLELDTHPIDTEIEDELPPVTFDAEHIAVILDNLVGNARKFSPQDSPISIRARRHGDGVSITVADQGKGIPRDLQDKIFDRFFQEGPVTTRSVRGMGIGLTLVRHLCRLMGAEISVESRPGGGSTFTVILNPAE